MAKEHILIIGGTKGAGRVAARLFGKGGSKVSVIARRLPERKERNVRYWQVDLLDRATMESTLKDIICQQGKPCGVIFFQRFRGQYDSWAGEIETTLTATKCAIETLVDAHGLRNGSIVLVSSINAHLISKHLSPGYHVAKAGLNQLVRYFAVALGSRGIRVNSISPGTFLKEESRKFFLKDKQLVRTYQKMIPLGRLCSAEEVVKVATFLCSRDASFVTGQDIIVDGGLSLVYQEALANIFLPARAKKPARTRA